MKINIKLFFSFLMMSFVFTACTFQVDDKEPEFEPVQINKEKKPAQAGYYCPMKCEGEKVYPDSNQKCPVCGMDLVKTD